ncbi:Leucine-rich repeat protein kinase family protein [Raphanus sativus]|uniref:non-specific serine/threonine protein kinase n=1 Tax=Raphanus sativus TaxID=3726 RepID=A0A6J0JF05_RAPSA|nr:probable LRR receptor-like serine/threonine-protein kinase At3g47570 [Raphanus sativus]KAJ4890415.1 Leucine-rich repeat protein kinase family protein [Raphanus sativus]
MRLFVLLLPFISLTLLDAYDFTDETDRQALLVFKSQVSQGKRVILSSWNHSFPLCNWYGVTCGLEHKRVTRLDLGGLQLGGVISPSIGNLSFLIYLNLSDNSFGGNIPQEVGNLFRLEYLGMYSNHLVGKIPTSLPNCSNLLMIDLYSNHLRGGVPSELGSLPKLVILYLGQNKLIGKLPTTLGNLTSMKEVDVGENNLEGKVPSDISRLTHLVYLELSTNHFSGGFPSAIYNLSLLTYLNIFTNNFSGSLRHDFGLLLPNLEELAMGSNYFTGSIPATIPNISSLENVRMEFNSFTGSVPPSFGKVQNLQTLALNQNSLGSQSVGDLDFIGALTNCTKLKDLDVGENRLGDNLPTSIANLSSTLMYLSLHTNLIHGSIPQDIGNLISLERLWLANNMLTGPLPDSLGKLLGLRVLGLQSNRLSGHILFSIGNNTRLVSLHLAKNSFQGIIPPSLGNCSYLLDLNLGYNKLNGIIPQEIMNISSLFTLSIPHNFLSGSLPQDVGQLEHLIKLSVEHNKLSGILPQGLGRCLSVEELYMQGNSFDGDIPHISGLVGVKRVDLSSNNLSGSIPEYFASFSKLEDLNLSINNLQGRVPTEGIFQNATIVSVFGNKDLCGGIKEMQLKPCFGEATLMKTKHSSTLKKVVIGVSVGIALLLLLLIVSLTWFIKRKRNGQTNNQTPSLEVFHERISYGDLRNATNGFSTSNLVGSGSFGAVFKALLPAENRVVAVKVLNMQRHGAMKSFMAECGSLKDIRHRNLVKLLTACSSIDFQGNAFRALIYEFMPNGNLDTWLHPEEVGEIHRPSRTLTLLERLIIAIDVASVLDYLHVQCHDPIAHCDLKPSNILLDNDLTAHVSDFGLARLLLKFDQESFLNQLSSAGVRGTVGYTAPEYGMGGQPSIHGDVYSFGILLLEMFTGKRPTSEIFEGNFTLHSYIKSMLPERVMDAADESILHNGLRVGFPIVVCLTLVFEVGLRCCEESPSKRLAMSEATKELISIKERFFKSRRRARH